MRKMKFIVIDFGDKAIDWPKDLSVPTIGDEIAWDKALYRVVNRHYSFFGDNGKSGWELRIYTKKI